MRFIGCKALLLDNIKSVIDENAPDAKSFCDIFSLLLVSTLKISVIVSRPFLTHSGFFLCEPPRSAVDKPSAARYNTFQRPSTDANLQLLRRIFSLSQCAALVKGDPLYGRFGSYYADHRGGTFS